MEQQQRELLEKELAELRQRVAGLETELAKPTERWQAKGFYASYYATTGFMLGIFGAAASLILNIVGSTIVKQHPLHLIQVYLTFPLGDKAMAKDFLDNQGLLLAVGCCLYLATGMLLGIVFQLVLAYFARNKGWTSLGARLILATALSVAVWLLNFYGILSWLQPRIIPDLSQENYIVNLVPWFVGLATHLVYGWTMAFVFPLGEYAPYRLPTEKS